MDSEKLNENIEKLNHNLERQLTWKFIILKGMVYGLGTAIGATVIAGIAFSAFTNTFNVSDQILPTEQSN